MKSLIFTLACLFILPSISHSQSLLQAAVSGDSSTVSQLLNGGADVNQTDSMGNTALILATSSGYIPVVSVLLQHSANVNQAANNGQTPLIVATQDGFIDLVSILLSNGADSNHQDNKKMRAFDYSVEQDLNSTPVSSGPATVDRLAVYNKLSLAGQ